MKVQRQTYHPKEVAVILGVHVSTVYRQIEEGRITALRVGRVLRIPIGEFHRAHPDLSLPVRD